MPPIMISDGDDDYASAEDSDFAPDAVPEQGSEDSASESEAEDPAAQSKPKSKKRKRGADEDAEDAGFENSGDEAIIERGLKRAKKNDTRVRHDIDDEGGEGGEVKTRSMRAQEKTERRPLADTNTATVDVDALWQRMVKGASAASASPDNPPDAGQSMVSSGLTTQSASKQNRSNSPSVRRSARESSTFGDGPKAMTLIKRTYTFAGKTHTEEKLVPKTSAEAKLFLASQAQSKVTEEKSIETSEEEPQRVIKIARRSIFEPVTENLPKRTDLHISVTLDEERKPAKKWAPVQDKGKKLNTVQKSAMDWAGFVDKEGIAEDLDAASRAKGAYGERQQFLGRVEARREDESRRARGLPS